MSIRTSSHGWVDELRIGSDDNHLCHGAEGEAHTRASIAHATGSSLPRW
jgi:hypothetical protein